MPSILPEPVFLPKGYGFRAVSPAELLERNSLLDTCLIFEAPRRRGQYQYVIGADIGDGLGQDRTAIEVLRRGTIDEPAEQVAEYCSDTVAPAAVAYILQALGQYYRDSDGVEAKIAVEYTHHGLSTIDTLHLHLQYPNQYVWEYFDAIEPEQRFGTMYGWHTTPRTRPVLVDKFRTALLTLDPITGLPDLITHSPGLHDELKDFQTAGALWEAAAARGAHDDRIMAAAIAYVVSWRMQAGESEPLEDRRRRRSEQQAALEAARDAEVRRIDHRNTPTLSEEIPHHGVGRQDPNDDDDWDALMYDLSGTYRDRA